MHQKTCLLFDEITHDLVVEVLNWSPLDALLDVFVLFILQCKLNEDLLELLVHIVARYVSAPEYEMGLHAKLFKAVSLERLRDVTKRGWNLRQTLQIRRYPKLQLRALVSEQPKLC